jgi:hypothetical protein
MQTILGANGIIGRISELRKTIPIKISRSKSSKVHPYDLFKADLLDPESVIKALNNTEIAYLTVGLR